MTGCYQPCHNCIDNCIHIYAGIQLRNYCNEIMRKQGHEEPTGSANIITIIVGSIKESAPKISRHITDARIPIMEDM
nr:macro domain-containing protein [uncultured Eubacterium sp.]